MNRYFMDWYKIKENESVLIIGKEVKEIEQYKGKKYDYIYLKGTLENANQVIQSKTPEIDLINFFKELLKEDGKLFIAVDNKQGVKYLVGNRSEHCSNIYDSLKNEFCVGRLFSKRELDEIIQKTEFKYKMYYYPLPNYEIPNVIFTDRKLPNIGDSKINYNIIYNRDSLILNDEIGLLKIFIGENKFREFTNSYIIELSNKEIKNNAKFYSFNTMRKEKYALILEMKDEYIEKYPKTPEAIEHIKNINKNSQKLKKLGFNIAEQEINEDIVKSTFINFKLLDEQIIESVDNKEKIYELIDNWYKYIMQKIEVDQDGIAKDGFIDLVFENTFYDDKKREYIFFDQEWYKENIPIKFILFRAIKNLYEHNSIINKKLPQKELWDRYNLNEFIDEFNEKEKEFQKEVIDEGKQKFYAEQYSYMISSEEVQQILNDIKKLDNDNVELIEEIKRLEEVRKNQDEIIAKQEIEINKTIIQKIKEKIFKR